MSQMPDLIQNIKDTKQQESASLILTRLLEDEQVLMIELIFNRIIIPNFEKEYHNMIVYAPNNSNNDSNNKYYQMSVFNTKDIMRSIFEFLEYRRHDYLYTVDVDLFNCCLVNSHWLYHAWNPNSIYHFELDRIITRVMETHEDNNCNTTRPCTSTVNNGINICSAWQTLIKTKKRYFYIWGWDTWSGNSLPFILSKILLFKNIAIKEHFKIDEKHLFILNAIISQCSSNIVYISIPSDINKNLMV